ncbi:hypothetical protein [Lewinella sp. 4G2]|uniref:hypothetical protein n=1 Tax=Lewinella sp. 4G2 TaxID=1803372 RepID=UPI0007B4F59C|nr:hypothetical protein [Lewinella sp. 4G2]OAV45277.1 hypothetical protein A3850_012580 [Lewinella sp. 4G2]
MTRLFRLCKLINFIASTLLLLLATYVILSLVSSLTDPRYDIDSVLNDVAFAAAKLCIGLAAALLVFCSGVVRFKQVDPMMRDDLVWAWLFAVPWLFGVGLWVGGSL